MPKLPTETIRVDTDADGVVKVPCRCHVTTEGVFFLEIPAPYFDAIKEFSNSLPGGYHDSVNFNEIEVRERIGEKMAFKQGARCRDLQLLIRFFKYAIKFHHTATKTEEKCLVYKYESSIRYWNNPDGTLFAHGALEGASKEGGWAGNRENSELFRGRDGLVLLCYCMNRTTFVRGKSKVVKWVQYRDDATHAGLLRFLSPGRAPDADDLENDGWTVIPHTDKGAEFFYRTLHSLCRIDDSLRMFFGSEANVLNAIKSGSLPLLK